jgi:hypothetical protein
MAHERGRLLGTWYERGEEKGNAKPLDEDLRVSQRLNVILPFKSSTHLSENGSITSWHCMTRDQFDKLSPLVGEYKDQCVMTREDMYFPLLTYE